MFSLKVLDASMPGLFRYFHDPDVGIAEQLCVISRSSFCIDWGGPPLAGHGHRCDRRRHLEGGGGVSA